MQLYFKNQLGFDKDACIESQRRRTVINFLVQVLKLLRLTFRNIRQGIAKLV